MSIPRNAGFTLVEVVILIVVLSAAIVGVLLIFQNTVRSSADPQVQKQVLAIAEAMLEEVLLTSYDVQPGTGTRANFDNVTDYNGYTTAPGGMVDLQGAAVPGLQAYNVAVAAAPVATAIDSAPSPCGPACPVSEAIRVTVTATGPGGISVVLEGFRMRYAGP